MSADFFYNISTGHIPYRLTYLMGGKVDSGNTLSRKTIQISDGPADRMAVWISGTDTPLYWACCADYGNEPISADTPMDKIHFIGLLIPHGDEFICAILLNNMGEAAPTQEDKIIDPVWIAIGAASPITQGGVPYTLRITHEGDSMVVLAGIPSEDYLLHRITK